MGVVGASMEGGMEVSWAAVVVEASGLGTEGCEDEGAGSDEAGGGVGRPCSDIFGSTADVIIDPRDQ